MKIESDSPAVSAFTPVTVTITIEAAEEVEALYTAATAAYANLNSRDKRSRRAESISSDLRDCFWRLAQDQGVTCCD